jgi:choline kinase
LLRKHCKEGASVATQFLTHVLINFQKNSKIAKNIENPKKYVFNTFASFFSIFSIVSKEFKFSKIFGTRSTFHASFFKSLISCIESMLIFARFQKYKRNKKNQNLQKKRKREGKEKLRD